MKFKILFGIFNSIIVLAFLAILLLPVFLVGFDYALAFWQGNWALVLVFLLVLAGVNVYFIRNWKLFSLLEQENWSALKQYLAREILERGRMGRQKVQLLMHSAVLTGDMGMVERLETRLREVKPALAARFAADFSLPHLLSAKPDRILAFVETYLPEVSKDTAEWLKFSRGFALTLSNKPAAAKQALFDCVQTTRNDVVVAIASYLIQRLPLESSDEEIAVVREADRRIRQQYDRGQWRKLVEQESRHIHILAFRSLLNDAESNLYGS